MQVHDHEELISPWRYFTTAIHNITLRVHCLSLGICHQPHIKVKVSSSFL